MIYTQIATRVCADLIKGAKKKELRAKGPIRTLRIMMRKTPCGEASKMCDHG